MRNWRFVLLATWLAVCAMTQAVRAVRADLPIPTEAIHTRHRVFRLPFQLEREQRTRVKQVQLCVSSDGGATWKPSASAPPQAGEFTYRAAADGTYYFAVRTQDDRGQMNPADFDALQADVRVVVDTTPPTITLTPLQSASGLAGVQWEMDDANLALDSFDLTCRLRGAGAQWQAIAAQPAVKGQTRWPIHGDMVLVQARVRDQAGNVGRAECLVTVPAAQATSARCTANRSADGTFPVAVDNASNQPTSLGERVSARTPGGPLRPAALPSHAMGAGRNARRP